MGFCSNCGSEMKEGAAFCGQCGAKAADVVQQGTVNTPGPSYPAAGTYSNNIPGEKKPNNKMIGMIAVGVAALLGLFLIVKLFGAITTPGYEKPLKYMVDGMQDSSFKKMMKAFPDYLTDAMEEELDDYYDGETKEFMDSMVGGLKEQYGKRVKISYDVKDKEKLDKDEINDLEDDIESMYDEKVNIKAAYNLEVEMKIKGSEDSDKEETEFVVIKIGSKWYLSDSFF